MSFFARGKGALVDWFSGLCVEEQWCVGMIEDGAFWHCARTGILSESEVQWLPVSGKYYLADPCWVSEKERLFAAECFDYRRRIASLVLAKVVDGQASPIRTIKLSATHLSYPMVYNFGGERVIIPESAQASGVSVMQIDDRGHVTHESRVLSGLQVVDPTVCFHGGSYWMFANPLDNFDNELVVFEAENVYGPWREASYSPMMISNCRGAGRIFEKHGTLYWPTQYNPERYGGGLILRRIVSLDQDRFQHDVVSVIRPDPEGSWPLGFHSISLGEKHHMVDGLRYVFSPLKPVDVLISRARRSVLTSGKIAARRGSDAESPG